ncbi:hypothetical protein DPMN_031707 [Dreissena polymorpha]|uniref:Uncharacterized protein n=1 Tax=Dreissena polymorpha TaxID=45954 RepID=A0A9D4RI99_DREPO|nr:hypothetical protein DPMN_031707 [Dreissena polymorpha]
MTTQVLASLLNRGSNVSGEAVVPSPLAGNLPYTPTRPEYQRFEASQVVTAEQDDVDQFEMLQELFPTPHLASSSPSLMPTFPISLHQCLRIPHLCWEWGFPIMCQRQFHLQW